MLPLKIDEISDTKADVVASGPAPSCINKKEAEQYFEDNLTLEVKIIDKKQSEKFNLVELNLIF